MTEGDTVLFPLSGTLEFGLKYSSDRLFQDANPLHTRKKLLSRHSHHSASDAVALLEHPCRFPSAASPALPGCSSGDRLHLLSVTELTLRATRDLALCNPTEPAQDWRQECGTLLPVGMLCCPHPWGRQCQRGSSPSSSTDSCWSLLPLARQDIVTHPPALTAPLEHQEKCLENAINKLQAQGKQHIQHFTYF